MCTKSKVSRVEGSESGVNMVEVKYKYVYLVKSHACVICTRVLSRLLYPPAQVDRTFNKATRHAGWMCSVQLFPSHT